MRPPRHGRAISIVLGALMLSCVVLSQVALWLSTVPAALFALAVTGVWVWSALSEAPTSADLPAQFLWRLGIVLGVLMGLLLAAAFAGFGALLRFAARAPSLSHTHPLEVQGRTVYLTTRQMAAVHTLEIAMVAVVVAAVLDALLSNRLKRGPRQGPQR